MPVDLSPAGRPSAYPRRPRFWPWWCCFWLACDVVGATIMLLLWPKGEPASGAWFWFCVVSIPNGVFLVLFANDGACAVSLPNRCGAYNGNRNSNSGGVSGTGIWIGNSSTNVGIYGSGTGIGIYGIGIGIGIGIAASDGAETRGKNLPVNFTIAY